MAATKTQLTGGGFQDTEGDPLINGYLKMRLSQDCSVPSVGNICSGIDITVQLDSNGNVAAGQSVWSNLVMSPVNNYYRVWGYTAAGQLAWGPNNQQVASGSTFNVGSWVPNTVISWFPQSAPPTSVTLQNNGTLNSSQQLLNLESTDSSIIITDLGGGNIDLQSGASTTVGNILFSDGSINLPYVENSAVDAAGSVTSDLLNGILITLAVKMVVGHVAFVPVVGAGSRNVSFAFYSADGNTKILDTGAIPFTGSSGVVLTAAYSSVTLSPGVYWFMQTGNPAGGVACTGWVARYIPQSTGSEQMCDMFANTANRLVFAANPRVGGVMPATLGALTPQTHLTANGIVQAMFY